MSELINLPITTTATIITIIYKVIPDKINLAIREQFSFN